MINMLEQAIYRNTGDKGKILPEKRKKELAII
jgi:hypothetical protein